MLAAETTDQGQKERLMPATKKRRKHIRNRPPRTAEEFFALSRREQDRWIRKTSAITEMRKERVSRTEAAKRYRLDPNSLPKSAVRKRQNGRYAVRARDTLLRVVVIPSEQGLAEVATRDSRQASELGRYSEAVHKYLETGDASALKQFTGRFVVDINGKQIFLMTDPAQLDRFGGPEFSYESFYARSA
jgi:hypothetical protein